MNKIVEAGRKARTKIAAVSAGTGALMLSVVPAFADDLGVWQGATTTIKGILTSLEAALKTIVVPIAGVALIFCFIMMLISQSQKKVESYRSWVITIVVSIVAIYAIPFIIELATLIGKTFRV